MGKRKLGRGLELLISRGEGEEPKSSATETQEVLLVDPADITENPDQPRQDFALSDLEGLKASIARDGVLQPVLVRKVGEGFQVVAGERRLRAARELGLERVPVIVADIPDERLLEVALVENIHRADLNPIELAQAYRRLMELRRWTQEQLSEELGLSRPSVANALRLLDLPEDIQRGIIRCQISMGHAKVLLSVNDDKLRRVLFEKIAEEKLSVRETELARDVQLEAADAAATGEARRPFGGRKDRKSPNVVRLEEELMEALGTRVTIRLRAKSGDKGVVSVSFDSKEEFEKLRSLLLGRVEA